MKATNFTNKVDAFYKLLRELGDEARAIINNFINDRGGKYTFDIENEDSVWVGDEIFATALKKDTQGNVLVFNSAGGAEYLHDMDDYNILEIATCINNLK